MHWLHPWFLLLLPVAAVPFLLKSRHAQTYSWLQMVPVDPFSDTVNRLVKAATSLMLLCLVLALAGPQGESHQEQKVGKGAQTVFVIDRSVSMDHPFAGQGTGGHAAEIKSAAARRLITAFIDSRPDDMMGVVGFTNSALYGMKITTNRDGIHSAIQAATGPALNQTNIGAGITNAVTLFESIPSTGSRAIVLLSDGAGKLSPHVKYQIRKQLVGKKLNLYWIVLREPDDISIFSNNTYDEGRVPEAIALDRFFHSLNIKYKAFEADNSTALESALREIDAKEKNVIQYSIMIPGHDYAKDLIVLAMLLGLALVMVKHIRMY
ncbi:von Willebrand factor type A domain-containing protein [Methylophilus rhizosphaerae]|uniref:von Willebrand factor type A domain-containing protein n=1 Tax=Methylophilus rhizosphaerae TaxID=492660 RepID=A0A1G8ZNE7_9PROT|nr:vWA domain-containing protein [Methylophilus rhizosphaerae]SDK16626.1 von Willebrand factor type A domain-containing protein [Methylophilus rhizosphaerae]